MIPLGPVVLVLGGFALLYALLAPKRAGGESKPAEAAPTPAPVESAPPPIVETPPADMPDITRPSAS